MIYLKISSVLICLIAFVRCTNSSSNVTDPTPSYSITMTMNRLSQAGVDPFRVIVTLTKDGVPLSGQTLQLGVPKGTVSAVTDQANGNYEFTVIPSATGTFPVTVTALGKSLTRKAVVLDDLVTGAGQPMAVPGDFVNTIGYEDGVTVTPDGQYLFVQYGPFYFAGIINIANICASGAYSIGYDLNTCDGRTNSSYVFNTVGPYAGPQRPGFQTGGMIGTKLRHLPSLIIGGVANGIIGFPTSIYGFKKQADGTFAEPFRVAFNDDKAIQGPFGISFALNGDGTTRFAIAYNNYLNDLGDDKPDIYTGTMTLGQDKSLGTVVYTGDAYAAITPTVEPVSFSSHTGTQGNPHLYTNSGGLVTSIWTDDESVSKDLTVYRLTSGTYPAGNWALTSLPTIINSAAEEDQPFFTGDKLIFSRDSKIVYHDYQPLNGACASGFSHENCWGPEVVLLSVNPHASIGEIVAVGEPTVATVGNQKYLYFVYVEIRGINGGIFDLDLDAAFVEIP